MKRTQIDPQRGYWWGSNTKPAQYKKKCARVCLSLSSLFHHVLTCEAGEACDVHVPGQQCLLVAPPGFLDAFKPGVGAVSSPHPSPALPLPGLLGCAWELPPCGITSARPGLNALCSAASPVAQLSHTQGPGEVCQATGPETSLFSPMAGYTVTSVVSSRQGRVYVAGAPRFNHTGKVILFTMHNNRSLTIHQALQGEQVTQGRLGAGQTGGTAAQLFPLRTVPRPTNVLPGWGHMPPSHPP